MLSIEYIRYFLEACECGSFQAAAKKLFISSQGLGTGIQRLENSIGLRLLNRSKSGVSPTQFGKLFFECATRVSDSMQELEDLCASYRDSQKCSLLIGVIGTGKFVGSISICAEAYSKKHPDADIDISTVTFSGSSDLFDALRNGEIDAGWIFHTDELPEFEYRSIAPRSPLTFICGKQHPLANRESVELSELESSSFIQPGKTDPFTDVLDYICQTNGFEENVAMYTTENSLIGNIIDCNIANMLVRTSYSPNITNYCKNAVQIPIIPEILVGNSILCKKGGCLREKLPLLDFVSDFMNAQLFNYR